MRSFWALFKQEDNYYKPTRVDNFWNNNYIKYESNSDSNKHVSVKEYLDKIKPYLRDVIINLQNSDTRKIQLTIANISIALFLLNLMMMKSV